MSKIKSTLDKELARVSSRVEFDTKKANDVLTKLNAQRKSEGLSSLSMDTSSEAYKLACIRAADMAIYDYSSSTSPMYGTLNDMCNLWKISSSHPSEKEVNIRIKYDSPSLPFLLSGKGLFVPFVLQPNIHYDSTFYQSNK